MNRLRAADPAALPERAPTSPHFATAWCAVGGARGGDVVPRWFGPLTDLGIGQAHLLWALPEADPAGAALDRLRSVSGRWLAELRGLGIDGAVSIKRGAPGPWLTELAALEPHSLVVVGPPRARGARSETIRHLLRRAPGPLLLLPDLVQPPVGSLLSRVVVDARPDHAPEPLGTASAGWFVTDADWLDLEPLDPSRAVRTALRFAEDVDASLLVLPRRSDMLAPLALEYGNFPILVPERTAAAWDDPDDVP